MKKFTGATPIHCIQKTTSKVLNNGIRIISSQYSSRPVSVSVSLWHFFSVHVFNIAKLLSYSNGSSSKVSASRSTRSVVLMIALNSSRSLISGKFSDLTIIHGTHKWNAHKVVVCSQSRHLEFLMENKTVRASLCRLPHPFQKLIGMDRIPPLFALHNTTMKLSLL